MAGDLDIVKDIDSEFSKIAVNGEAKNGAIKQIQQNEEGLNIVERRQSQIDVIEEGQAEEIDVGDKTFVMRKVKQQQQGGTSSRAAGQTSQQSHVSNLLYYLQLLEFFFNEFETIKDQKTKELAKTHNKNKLNKKSHSMSNKYIPQYFQKFTLFEEDMKSGLPEIFILQSLISLECLQNPIKDQMISFRIDESEKRFIRHMRERGEALLKDIFKH